MVLYSNNDYRRNTRCVWRLMLEMPNDVVRYEYAFQCRCLTCFEDAIFIYGRFLRVKLLLMIFLQYLGACGNINKLIIAFK